MSFTFHERHLGVDGSAGRPRLVDRLVLHGPPLDARRLLERVVTHRTRFLVLDLDRTIHLGRNIGELLGWELTARRCYGKDYLRAREAGRLPGRLTLAPTRPWALAHYLARGAAAWAYPGLYYLLWGKIGSALGPLARHRYSRFGDEPHRVVQQVPTIALLHQLAEIPVESVRAMTRSVLRRHADDQVIDRADIDWIKKRFPNLTVVLSSASPSPVVEVAAELIGADEFDATDVEQVGDRLSAPYRLHPLYLAPKLPQRLSPTSAFRINAGHAKIERLFARHPEITDPETEVVGISDTSHGEDHAWTQYFTRVVDINSTAPFPPIVAADSPLRELHSAQLLSRRERRTGARDPRRRGLADTGSRRTELDRRELSSRLAPALQAIDAVAATHDAELARVYAPHARIKLRTRRADRDLADAVTAYNAASPRDRASARKTILAALRQQQLLARAERRLLRAALKLRCDLDRRLAAARQAVLDGADDSVCAPRQLASAA